MTRYRLICLKAAWLLLALFIGLLLSVLPADGQSVQAMVKAQPFPYAQGVAMDSPLYRSVKAKLEAAEDLRISAQHTIDALSTEIDASRKAYADLQALDQYDAARADSLRQVTAMLEPQLTAAQGKLNQANQATDSVLQELPRRTRKALKGATPDQIATAVVDYIHTLQQRKWTWSAASALLGIGLTVFKVFL